MRMSAYHFSHIPAELFAALGHYRRRVFIELQGWELAQDNGLELDQFDTDTTVYLIAQDDSDGIVGCARLLRTTGPYLLGTVFPQLLDGGERPDAADVWELSRFAAMDLNRAGRVAEPFTAPLAVELLHTALQYAAGHGVRQLVAVISPGVETLLRRAGFQAHRAGAVQTLDGYRLMACRIETQPSRSWGRNSECHYKPTVFIDFTLRDTGRISHRDRSAHDRQRREVHAPDTARCHAVDTQPVQLAHHP